jgi:DNA-binding CsgD family transcriptional regulator
LRRGLELAETFAAAPLAARAHGELRASGGRRGPSRHRSGVEQLTPSEQRIAEMAAHGASNREIAAELFLAGKTVEWHLGHAYRKLGIRSRRELPAALTAIAPSGDDRRNRRSRRRNAAVPST